MDQRGTVERARRGDHDAFTQLVDLNLARLDSAARLILRDPELARDAVQEGLVRAWRDLPGLRDPDRFEAWLYRLTTNACLDLARHRRRRPIEVELTAVDGPSAPDHSGAMADRELIHDALGRLDPGHRAVIALHYLLDMPLAEVAAILRIPVGTAKSRHHYALAAMRAHASADADAIGPKVPRRAARMTAVDRFERDLPAVLEELYQGPRPAYRDDLLSLTERTSQRPGWTFPERWLPMSALTERLAPAPRLPWRTIGAVALIVLALVAGALFIVGSQPKKLPAPFGPAANGRIAYAADGDIFTVDPATGVSGAIVTGSELDLNPQFSRDGTKVVFARTVAGGQSQLFVVDATGGTPTLVTPEPLRSVASYEFSPDGTSIAVSSYEAAEANPTSTVPREVISIAKADGSGVRNVGFDGSATSPTFRPPDGHEIAFVGGSASEGQGIFAYDLAADLMRTIVEPAAGFEVTGGPSYSPDGSMIAYGWWGSAQDINSRVYVVDADGTGPPRLVEPPASDLLCCEGGQMAWSNDRTRLAHFRMYEGRLVVAITPWDSGGTGTEFEHPAMEGASLAWSPDDRYLLIRPSDSAQSPLEQVLFDVGSGATVPTDWTATSAPAWQRLAIE